MGTEPTATTASTNARSELLGWHAAYDQIIQRHVDKNPSVLHDAFRERYQHDAPSFVRDCFSFLPGEAVAEYQGKALQTLMDKHRLAVRSLHGTGKSTLAAWVTLWATMTADDVKVPTTAGGWRQLEKFLWPEIHKWLRRFRWGMAGIPPIPENLLNVMNLRLSHTAEAFAVASDKHELIEGAHAKRIVYVFDESKAIPPATWDAAEGAFTGGGGAEAYALAISTPGEPAGRFYDICSRKAGYEDWAVMHVTLEEAVQAGRVSQSWADQRKLQWGERSPMFQNRVLGNFCASEENGIIPLAWVEAAQERWLAWKESKAEPGILTSVGVDVARSGDDLTVLAPRHGDVITELVEHAKEDTMQTTGRVVVILSANKSAEAVVDVIGVGAGVVDRLVEQGYAVQAFNAGEGTDRTDRSGTIGFVNKRSAAWWALRDLLDPAFGSALMLPPSDLLVGDLTTPRWSITSTGKIKLESKDDIKKRIGRSTDHGDAVVQALWAGDPTGAVDDLTVTSIRTRKADMTFERALKL